MSKVGIVIINYNSMNCLRVTMKSLMLAKTDIPFEVGIIDNGSDENEKSECELMISSLKTEFPNAKINFFVAEKNLGFSGGNNVVIKYFLGKEDITHICLLNSDVIVTDFWLDYLLEKGKDVIGPVTNAAGNEQTVQIDYSASIDEGIIRLANEFARKRHICYKNYVVNSDLVTFFATIFKREVIENIGLLDEQFYPGSYEDDDYCIRILEAGYQISIARDCFLHHFGSGSFSKLNMHERTKIGNINRERFEKKWNRKWNDRTWKLLESCKQDIDYLLKNEQQEWARQQIDISMEELEKLMADWGEAILFFTTQSQNNNVPVYDYSIIQLIQMLRARIKRRIHLTLQVITKKTEAIIYRRKNRKNTQSGMSRIYQMIECAKKEGREAICVFAPMYNKENEKDGYVQRIKAIDTTVLDELCRIYLYDEGVDCVAMRFDFIDPLHGYIVFNSHNQEHLKEIIKLVKKCGKTYTHSVLRFMEDRTDKQLWTIFESEGVRNFWDMHGTVPEEYEFSGSELGCQLANNIESYMAKNVDVVVVVTEAMGRYLKNKYPQMQAQVVVVPILNKELLEPVVCKDNKLKEKSSIVYAGGTQPWQNIELMQNVINSTQHLYEYRMYVPSPDEFWRLWGNRNREGTMVVESKTPEELYKEYESCDLGFVLRDSCPVNYVACPTKIIEYLKFGIIPILKSTEIGDFIDLGMKYVLYEDLLSGKKLSDEERKDMVESNYIVLTKLTEMYIEGRKKLTDLVKE